MRSQIFILATALIIACQSRPKQDQAASTYLLPDIMCGTVQFSDGCGSEMDSLISFGLALIHHMTFDDAEHIFNEVIDADPDCFWGHWGKALSYIHPLWPDRPSEAQMQKGWALSQKALALVTKEKERRYGEAVAAYYENGESKSERERLAAYEAGWQRAHEADSDDIEARIFYALSRLSMVSPEDKTYAVQREVGQVAEGVLEEIPDHPGGFHYAIHAYDYPPLAHHAVRVARNYSKIAPEIPHALHMPTHIFTRLGHWQESIDWNIRSANAAEKLPVNGAVSLHYLHALDYLAYAHLQQGEDQKAQAVMEQMMEISGPIQSHNVSAYALAAVPARWIVERHAWGEVGEIKLPQTDNFAWEKFPAFEALFHFGAGIAGARSGDLQLAQHSYERLVALQETLGRAKSAAYWSKRVEIQKKSVLAWLRLAEGKQAEALLHMIAAAELEDKTEKNPVTPGEILPARELLGDMYLELGQSKKALQAYEASLQSVPNRFNSIYGAASAAERSGNEAAAKGYYASLVRLCADRPVDRERLAYARRMSGS